MNTASRSILSIIYRAALLSTLFCVPVSAQSTGTVRQSNLRLDRLDIQVKALQSGRPTITGLPTYNSGVKFLDGTVLTSTTQFSAYGASTVTVQSPLYGIGSSANPIGVDTSTLVNSTTVFLLKSGGTMTGQLTLSGSTLTVGGNAFSVGGSTFQVASASVSISLAGNAPGLYQSWLQVVQTPYGDVSATKVATQIKAVSGSGTGTSYAALAACDFNPNCMVMSVGDPSFGTSTNYVRQGYGRIALRNLPFELTYNGTPGLTMDTSSRIGLGSGGVLGTNQLGVTGTSSFTGNASFSGSGSGTFSIATSSGIDVGGGRLWVEGNEDVAGTLLVRSSITAISSVTASAFFGDGSHLTGISAGAATSVPAGGITGGPVDSAILPSTVAYTTVSNTFTSSQTIQGGAIAFTVASTITTNGTSLTISTDAAASGAGTQNIIVDANGLLRVNGHNVNAMAISTTIVTAANLLRSPFSIEDGVVGPTNRQSYLTFTQPTAGIARLAIGEYNSTTLQGPVFSMDIGSGTLDTPAVPATVASALTLATIQTTVSSGTAQNILTFQKSVSESNWKTDGSGSQSIVYPTAITWGTTLSNAKAAAEKVRLTSTGTLAIGLTNPTATRLEVSQGSLADVQSSSGVIITGNTNGNYLTYPHADLVIQGRYYSQNANGPAVGLFIKNTNPGDTGTSDHNNYMLRIQNAAGNIYAENVNNTYGQWGIGTLSPEAHFHISSAPVLGAGYTTPSTAVLIDGDANMSLQAGSTMTLTANGHFNVGGSSMPALSSCGTGPSMNANSNDHRGTFTTGSATGTGCTVTFKNAYATTPFCIVVDKTAGLTSPTWTEGTTTLTLTSLISSDTYGYICEGQ